MNITYFENRSEMTLKIEDDKKEYLMIVLKLSFILYKTYIVGTQ